MVTIYLCDNNATSLRRCKELLEHLIKKNSLNMRIQLFNDGKQLLSYYEQYPNDMEILYIEAKLKNQNGIDVVKQLQATGTDAEVIYLAASEDYVLEAFDTSPLHYLLKTQTPMKKFEEVLLKAYSKISNRRTDVFTCESNGLTKCIFLRSIAYFDMQSRIVTVHYNNGETFSFYSKMEQLQNKLADKHFVRSHRSFLVNLKYIAAVTKDDILLYDGTSLPLGITYSKQLKQEYKEISGPYFLKAKTPDTP